MTFIGLLHAPRSADEQYSLLADHGLDSEFGFSGSYGQVPEVKAVEGVLAFQDQALAFDEPKT